MVKSKNMIRYVIKRILFMIPMLLLVLISTFIITHMMFGDPVLNKLGILTEPETLDAERIRMGYDKPILVQLLIYLRNFFTGDWGKSYIISENKPVMTIISEIFPKTIELVIIPIVIIPIIAVKLGVVSAKNKDNARDTLIRGIGILGTCIPVFWLATILQYFVGHYLAVYTYGELNLEIMFPNSVTLEYPRPEWPFHTGFRIIDGLLFNDQALLQDTLLHLILPMICMTFVSIAGITRQTRASMLEILEQDYIRTARAKGCEEKDVYRTHVLKNSLISITTVIGLNLASLFSGAILIEVTFGLNGIGKLLIDAVFASDYWVLNAVVFVITMMFLITTLIMDVIYSFVDPRIRI